MNIRIGKASAAFRDLSKVWLTCLWRSIVADDDVPSSRSLSLVRA